MTVADETQPAVTVTLCATRRLARHLQLRVGRYAVARGATVWAPPQAFTLDAWFAATGEAIALTGEAPAEEIPERVLTPYQTTLIWRRLLEAEQALDLFDRHSLATSAAEADALVVAWRLRLDACDGAEETGQFRIWRQRFFERCCHSGWLDPARYRERVLDWLARGLGHLPASVQLAGFDAPSPQLQRLKTVLQARGVMVEDWQPGAIATPRIEVRCAADAEAECALAADWARARLQADPAARLGIVVADMEVRRARLAPLLDAALDPAAQIQGRDTPSSRYNLSLGLPLARHELVGVALTLLRGLAQPQGLLPQALGALLCRPYWSADMDEADLRARLDARLRELPGQTLFLTAAAHWCQGFGKERPTRLVAHLHAWAAAQAHTRTARRPSEWAEQFCLTLAALGWPGERSLSSTEYQLRAAFDETLARFGQLDAFLGPVGVGPAVSELQRLCGETLFQPQTLAEAPVQVLGMLEATGGEFDALWVMGLNDELWPPPARPNPLLPAELQRRHRTPSASAEVQAAFARTLFADLLQTAPELCFSYAAKDGDRSLRPSPLLAGWPAAEPTALAQTDPLPAQFDFCDDAIGPPVAEGETVSGGSSLLRAQALCPAWAFYRYRLGAQALQTPGEGLDAALRGQLVHATLEAFWLDVRDLAGLQALNGETVRAKLVAAAEQALMALDAELGEALGPTLRALEAQRLVQVCGEWLRVEWDGSSGAGRTGRASFAVAACEEVHTLTLGRLSIRLVIDRIDVLAADGRRVVLDYKTGGKLDLRQWSRERIGEPQLPLYAALALGEPGADSIAAVAFAKVRRGDCRFTGVAAADGLLPGVPGPDELAWAARLDEWRRKLLALAAEIERGEAAVRFEDERDLDYCEVLPLLRLPERRTQFEAHHD